MKSITSKLSIIILSLLAMAFTFVLGTASSNAVSDETEVMNCIAQIEKIDINDPQFQLEPNQVPNRFGALTVIPIDAINQIVDCAKQQ